MGGALTREKIIAYHSKKVIIIADDSKVVKILGIDFPLPVEVLKFEWESTKKTLKTFGCDVKIRKIFDIHIPIPPLYLFSRHCDGSSFFV